LLWDLEPKILFLGRAIRQQREQQNITAGELAGKAGVGMRRLERLEAGRLDPDFELLGKLADALGTKPSTFVVRAEARYPKGGPQ
jgi:transcriptional regulator with XRE-family HTH domain